MKLKNFVFLGLTTLGIATYAQGTAFTYQGRLNSGGTPANGSHDLAFTLFSTNVTGIPLAGPVTNVAVAVSNGLFTTLVDFGPARFTGASNWLELAVRTNGLDSFTPLTPRQQLTPMPYALFASAASNLLGAVPLAQLPSSVVTNNANSLTLAGTFTGNGAGLTNLTVVTSVNQTMLPAGVLDLTNCSYGDSITAGSGSSLPYGKQIATAVGGTAFVFGFPGRDSQYILTNSLGFLAQSNLWTHPTILAPVNIVSDTNRTLADIATMVACLASVGNTNYCVISAFLNTNIYSIAGGRQWLLNWNGVLSNRYAPAHFADVYGAVRAAATTNAVDQYDVANGGTPASLRSDSIHLNDAGYGVMAKTILDSGFGGFGVPMTRAATIQTINSLLATKSITLSNSVATNRVSWIMPDQCYNWLGSLNTGVTWQALPAPWPATWGTAPRWTTVTADQGMAYRYTPQQTAGYTNMAVTWYLYFTNSGAISYFGIDNAAIDVVNTIALNQTTNVAYQIVSPHLNQYLAGQTVTNGLNAITAVYAFTPGNTNLMGQINFYPHLSNWPSIPWIISVKVNCY